MDRPTSLVEYAAPAGHHDHRLALAQSFGAVGGVAEGAAWLGKAVDPGLSCVGMLKL